MVVRNKAFEATYIPQENEQGPQKLKLQLCRDCYRMLGVMVVIGQESRLVHRANHNPRRTTNTAQDSQDRRQMAGARGKIQAKYQVEILVEYDGDTAGARGKSCRSKGLFVTDVGCPAQEKFTLNAVSMVLRRSSWALTYPAACESGIRLQADPANRLQPPLLSTAL